MATKPVVLCILDGWGYRDDSVDNAIKLATTPTYDRLWSKSARAMLKTSGLAVGLPEGQMGNSEVGHMNIGSGRVILQDLPRIDATIEQNTLKDNAALRSMIAALKQSGGTAHLMGLVSDGGVHSHINHIIALAKIIDGENIPVALHAFLDGRDTPPRSADGFIATLEAAISTLNHTKLATITGRYWAMDRDKRWDRVEKAYRALTSGEAAYTAQNGEQAVAMAYDRDENDEFVEPTLIESYAGMQEGDGLLMANFRADRAREILTALIDPKFDGFTRETTITFAAKLGMVEFSTALNAHMAVMFQSIDVQKSLGEVVSSAGLNQLRIAETEKYAHVTFFFNGGKETVFEGEDRILIPSPNVATYDLQPEMSAPELTDNLIAAIESGKFSLIVVNFANPDMVGHTGILSAAIKAVETIDGCLSRIEKAVANMEGDLLITADHGNVELMKDQTTGKAHTAHTSFDVPLLMVNSQKAYSIKDGCLADIAPTILALMALEQPAEMTGENLLLP